MVYYTSCMGYSDDGEGLPEEQALKANKWWSVQFYHLDERQGKYLTGPWRRRQVLRAEKEVLEHKFALLGLADMMEAEDELVYLFRCTSCGQVNSFRIRRDTAAARCLGCGLLWDIEQVLRSSAAWASRREIDRYLQGSMIELAAAQGYTVGVDYVLP